MNKSLWNSQNYVGSEKHAHTHPSFEQSHLSSFKKTLDAEHSSTWKSHHLHTALTRAVSHGLDAHPVTGILHGILVDATMSRTTSPRLWNAFATSAFTDDDKDPWGMMCQLKPEGEKGNWNPRPDLLFVSPACSAGLCYSQLSYFTSRI